jgi:squalene-hopene/tetraprenyl-beta-curcumene cyclase
MSLIRPAESNNIRLRNVRGRLGFGAAVCVERFPARKDANMDAGRSGSRRLRFDLADSLTSGGPNFDLEALGQPTLAVDERLQAAIERTRSCLLGWQHQDGHWVGELEGDTILESEYVLLLAYLGREKSDVARKAAAYILAQQLPEGGWAIYPGGPLEISASVKAYFALKLTGLSPQSADMVRAREAILAAGGAEKINSFTRYYLALLGVISYRQCPAVPPELMLLPTWMPFNIYEMSAWSRTIIVPLSILWAYKPFRKLPGHEGIDELFRGRPQDLPVTMPKSEQLDGLSRRTWVDWQAVFCGIDRVLKFVDRWKLNPLRNLAVRRAARWMQERLERSDGLGAIFPPIIWSVVALKCLGHGDDSPAVQTALHELDRLMIEEQGAIRLQPCKSPVWDTAISMLALREAGLSADAPAIRNAVRWLLSKEVRTAGDWTVLNPGHEPAGWSFEYNNEFYPDVDDTSMVLMALCRSLPSIGDRNWRADFLLGNWSPHPSDKDAAAIVSARGESTRDVFLQVEAAAPQLNAIWRGTRWILAMQGRDGGWGAFDPNNNRELFTRVPFADHNAMIDPSTVDLTGRMLELFGDLNIAKEHPAVHRAIEYVWQGREADHCWYGRWGVNYIYGTWQALVGLAAVGVPPGDARMRLAARWLKSRQQADGGWGETPRSYDDPSLRGVGPTTASQTAWALMGLMAAGEGESEEVRRGVEYLLETQNEDGTWDEPWFTGTGFPRVFFLKYHLYRIYFPLMALARHARQARTGQP